MKNKIKVVNFDESKNIYIIKAMAIFFVVCAHVATVPSNTIYMNSIFSEILSNLGTMGVGIFYFLAGYIFRKNNKSFKKFINRKFRTIIVPWIITGSSVYIYIILRKGTFQVEDYLNFILGNGSYLYYLSVLIFMYLFYFKIKNKLIIIATAIISSASIIFTAYGYLGFINPFLNPLNWMLYFSLGLLLDNSLELNKIFSVLSRNIYLCIFLWGINIVGHIYFNEAMSYWSLFSIPSTIISLLLVFSFASKITGKAKNIIFIGKESFTIYLLHMPVAGMVVNVLNKYNLYYLTLLRPFIVIFITMLFIFIYKNISKMLKVEQFSSIFIGTDR